MSKKSAAATPSVTIPYYSIRNISCPEDVENGRTVHSGHLPVEAILELPSHENVRAYLRDAEGKQRRKMTQVHHAIWNTLRDHPEEFSVLNGGLVIVARASEMDDKQRVLRLDQPSIINGSQTQGVVRDFIKKYGQPDRQVHIKFELIVTDDVDLVAEISIARNFQNDVESISIAGRRGQLDELEERIRKAFPERSLQKSETQRPAADNEYLETEKLLQVVAALLPADLWWKPGEVNKVYTYNKRAVCLKDFQTIYNRAKTEDDPEHSRGKEVYNFFLDIAPAAWELYLKWKTHQGFAGTGIRALERDGRAILDVPDAIVFPVIAAHSEFVVKDRRGWVINIPKQLDDRELVQAAKTAYQEIAKSRPEIMGKTKACYTAVQQVTAIYKKLLSR